MNTFTWITMRLASVALAIGMLVTVTNQIDLQGSIDSITTQTGQVSK